MGQKNSTSTDNTNSDTKQDTKQESKYELSEEGAITKLKKDPNDMGETIAFKYIEKKKITHDTFIFVYEIPNDLTLGINIGEHISIDEFVKTKENPEGEVVSRKYTPVSWIKEKGKFELLIKVYFKNVNPDFPDGGIISQYLNDLEIGKSINCRGPFGKLKYLGNGNFDLLKKYNPKTYERSTYKNVVCLAGGTGITPFYQIIQAAFLNGDNINITLIFGNKTSDDILLKKELEEIEKSKKINFKLVFTIDKGETDWTGEVGFIGKNMLKKYCPEFDKDTYVLACGPPIMLKFLLPQLKEMGLEDKNYYSF